MTGIVPWYAQVASRYPTSPAPTRMQSFGRQTKRIGLPIVVGIGWLCFGAITCMLGLFLLWFMINTDMKDRS